MIDIVNGLMEEIKSETLYQLFIGIGLLFIIVHIALYSRLQFIKKGIKDKHYPLNRQVRQEYNYRRQSDAVRADSFIQEFFSNYKILKVIPVVNLIKTIQMTVSAFILVGVLGTFIGLTDSLSNLDLPTADNTTTENSPVADGNSSNEAGTEATNNELVEKISSVLSGIHVAFYTSIIGMTLSLVMTILLRIFNTEQLYTKIMLKLENDLEEKNEDTLGKLIKVMEGVNQSIVSMGEHQQRSTDRLQESQTASNDKMIEVLGKIESSSKTTVTSLENLSKFSEGFNQAAVHLEGFNQGLHKNVEQFTELFGSMKQVTDVFGSSVQKLNENFDGLFHYFKNVDDRQEAFIETFQTTSDKFQAALEEQKLFQANFSGQMDGYVKNISEIKAETTTYLADSNRVLQAINDQNEEFVSDTKQYQTVLKDSYERLQTQNEELITKLDDNIDQLKEILGAEFTNHLENFRQTIDEKISLLSSQFVQLSDEMNIYNEASTNMSESLQQISSDQVNYQRIMEEREAALQEMNQQLAGLNTQFYEINENIDHSVGEQSKFFKEYFEQQQRVAASYDGIEVNNHQLLTEINSAIDNMHDTFNSREEEIEMTLSKLVNDLDANINKSFMNLVGEMGQYVAFTNEIMENQLKEMGLLNQTYQEGSNHHILYAINTLQKELNVLNQTISQLSQAQHVRNQLDLEKAKGL